VSGYSFFDVKQISSTDMNEWNHDRLDKLAIQIVHTALFKAFLSSFIIKIWKLNYYSYANLLCILFCIGDVVKWKRVIKFRNNKCLHLWLKYEFISWHRSYITCLISWSITQVEWDGPYTAVHGYFTTYKRTVYGRNIGHRNTASCTVKIRIAVLIDLDISANFRK
jgi:hypothetical protein